MKNLYSSYRFTATFLLLITLGIGNMWADYNPVYLNGTFDLTGGSVNPNWDSETYHINYSLGDGHYFLPFYSAQTSYNRWVSVNFP